MFDVNFSNDIDGIATFMIDDEEYSEDGQKAVVPKAVLRMTDISSIPYNFTIEIRESQCESMIEIKIPVHFQRIGEKEFSVRYEEFIKKILGWCC